MVKLSVIILSYNTKELTKRCLETLFDSLEKSTVDSEIIVIDNASEDGSSQMLDTFRKNKPVNVQFQIIKNKTNIGFTGGNNQGIASAKSEYILLLNSDVTVDDVDFKELLAYMSENQQIGVLTVKVLLPSGGIDPASHRGFPTPWSAFCYFFKLEKFLGKGLLGRFFGGYHLTNLDLNTIHEIDSPAGAFYLTKKDILEKVEGFDEHFFMYGEDLDLSYRIKKMGYKIIYYPKFTVTHYKHKSGLKSQNNTIKHRVHTNFYDSMKIFYQKHYERKYPSWVTKLIYVVIDFKKNT